MNDKMNFINNSEILKLKDDSKEKLNELLTEIHKSKLRNELCFSEFYNWVDFWNLCDNPVLIMFKYGNHYFVTRDKQRISEVKKEMSEKEMQFIDLAEIPQKTGGRSGTDWLAVLAKIPVGKAWTPEPKEYKVQTIRGAIKELEESKKLKTGQYEVTQRTKDKKTTIYVKNNGEKTEKKKK